MSTPENSATDPYADLPTAALPNTDPPTVQLPIMAPSYAPAEPPTAMLTTIESPTATLTADGPSTVELAELPAIGPLYRRAALRMFPRPGRPARATQLPATGLLVRNVTVDREHLAAYDRACGFRLTDALPATYPHVLAFPLTMHLLAAPDFPVALVGLVHVANQITTERAIDAGEPLDLSVRAVDLRPHHRGRQFDVLATATVDGVVVWRSVSTYLSREKGATTGGTGREVDEQSAPPAATGRWSVDRHTGTTYGRVSGDRNPIHTSRLGARLLGFRRPIAHGMWSKARCLAVFEGRLPDAYTVDVAFKTPIPLPGTAAFRSTPTREFTLYDERSGKPHLVGSVKATTH
ncbi:MaoC/PaaZ C-terminal domain-containing protein [Micromonospora polyrhachis]|uniref:Acyl dehydratase n=2 Tax=Micromonospora polyrhachis TaxID=1282883 RepID=A0A7W7WPN9_9ACTN|nr:acyl dehydratase [Micromonospora polyrhachis]